MTHPISPTDSYELTIVLLGIGSSVRAMETLQVRDSYAKDGIFRWEIAGNDIFHVQNSFIAALLRRVYGKTGMVVLSTLTLLTFGLVLALPEQTYLYRLSLLLFLGVNLLVYYRQSYGLDGADQMSLLITLTTLLCYGARRTESLMAIGLMFIGCQVALSYFVSGVAKLISPQWRSGLAIEGIWSTYTYGSPTARRLVWRSRGACIVLSWATIAVEILLPFSLLLDSQLVVFALVVGFLFHFAIAIVMGLNDFVWAFVAGYPAFYYLSQLVSSYL